MAMTSKEFNELREGDLIRNDGSGQAYVVVMTDKPDDKIAVRMIHATNPSEWSRIKRRC